MALQAQLPQDRVRVRPTWLGAHSLLGGVVITALTAAGLQLTHVIDFQEQVAEVVGWTLWVRFIDFGFRNLLGVLVVAVVFPWLWGFVVRGGGLQAYFRHLRLGLGPVPRFTAVAALVSALILTLIVTVLSGVLGVLRLEPAFWVEDSRWFIVILSLVPGVWEELAFRGLVLSNLQLRSHRWTAIIASALLFGVMHFTNLLLREPSQVLFEVIMAASVGIAWGYLTVKTGSVLPAMGMHYLINVLIGMLLDDSLSEGASAILFGSVTIAYPVFTVVAVWWLGRLGVWRSRGEVDPSHGQYVEPAAGSGQSVPMESV